MCALEVEQSPTGKGASGTPVPSVLPVVLPNTAFLQWWYGRTDGLYLTSIPADGGSPKRCDHNPVEVNAGRNNVYLSVNPVKPEFTSGKATEADVLQIRRVVLDIDPPDGIPAAVARERYLKVIGQIQQGTTWLEGPRSLKPTVAYPTGRCGALAFNLTTPLEPTEENIARAKRLHRKLARVFDGDHGGSIEHLYKAPLQGTTAWMKQSKRDEGWDDTPLGAWHWTDGPTYTLEELEAATAGVPDADNVGNKEHKEGWFNALAPVDQEVCAEAMLATLNPDMDYSAWMNVGMALHSVGNDRLLDVWDAWSSKGSKFLEFETAYKWRTLNKSGISMGTLVYMAIEADWDKAVWVQERATWWQEAIEANPDDPELWDGAMRLLRLLPTTKKRAALMKLKKITHGGVTLGAAKEVEGEIAAEQAEEDGEPDMSHDAIARDIVEAGNSPITCNGDFWNCEPLTNLWTEQTDSTVTAIAEKYDHEKLCKRSSDYGGIAKRLMGRTRQDDFFKEATVGVSCSKQIVHIKNNELKWEPLTREHRQTFTLPFMPAKDGQLPELLFSVLREGMGEEMPEADKQNQLDLLGEMLGLALLGSQTETRRALLLKGPTSCGKSTLLEAVCNMLPSLAVASVPPTTFDNPEAICRLGVSRINVVTELKNTGAIAGAEFKNAVEGAKMQARKLYVGHYSMRPIAGNLLATNVWPSVDSPDSGFWERWAVVTFHHTKADEQRDPELKNKLKAEYPQILKWLLDSVHRYLQNGRTLSLGQPHAEGLAHWKVRRDSVAAFLFECSTIMPRAKGEHRGLAPIKQTQLHMEYANWFQSSDYKHPVSRNEFYERVVASGGKPGVKDGYSVFHSWASKFNGPKHKN